MIALVVGGAGFIGQATCAALLERGATPVVADRTRPADRELDFHHCDVTDADQVTAAVDAVRPDTAVHLAALLGTDTNADPMLGLQVNVTGMQNVLEACAGRGVKRAVYASSIAVYGDQSDWGDHAVREEDHGRPAFLYGWHKQLNEATADHYQRSRGLRCIGLRISTVYGAGRKTGMSAPVNALIEGAVSGVAECPFGPDADSCMVHVDDIAIDFATLATADEPQHDVYNAGGEFSTIGQLAAWIRELHPGVEVRLGPAGERIPHVSLVDGSRLGDEFGLRPRSFEAWVRDALAAGAGTR